MRYYTIVTDLEKALSYKPPMYKQYDSGQGLSVEILTNGQSTALDGYTATAYFRLPNQFQSVEKRDGTINGNTISIVMDSILLGSPGAITFEIELHKDLEVTTTFMLQYTVEERFAGGGRSN